MKFKRVLSRSFASLALRGLGVFGSFFLTTVVARAVSKEQAGYFFLAFSVATILATVSRFGSDNSLVRFVSGRGLHDAASPASDDDFVVLVLNRVIVFSGLLCFLTLLVSVSAWYVFPKYEGLVGVTARIAIGIIGLAGTTTIAYALQGQGRVVWANFLLLILINYGFMAGVVISNASLGAELAWIYSLTSILAFSISLVVVFPRVKSLFYWGRLPDYFYESCKPLFVVAIVNLLLQWFGQFYISYIGGAEDVADYTVALRLSLVGSVVVTAVNFVVGPMFSKMHNDGRLEDIKLVARNALRFIAVLCMPMFIIIMLKPGYFLSFFGEGYVSAGVLLRILVFGQSVNIMTGCVAFLLIMTGNEVAFRNSVLASGGILLFMTPLLGCVAGVEGVAIATSIAVATQNIFAAIKVQSTLGFNPIIFWR